MARVVDGALNILVVEDHEFVAYALANLLDAEDGVAVVATTGDGRRAIDLVRATPVDVVVLDLRLADGVDAIDLIPQLFEASPDVRVLVLSAWSDDRSVARAIEAGCHGYLLKDQAVAELVPAVLAVAKGETVFAPAVMPRVLDLIRPRTRRDALTAREAEVLQLLAEGVSTDEIAAQLYLSVNTIRNHVHNIIRKLGVRSRLEAVAHGIRQGLVDVR